MKVLELRMPSHMLVDFIGMGIVFSGVLLLVPTIPALQLVGVEVVLPVGEIEGQIKLN
jgi:hypothetical protein